MLNQKAYTESLNIKSYDPEVFRVLTEDASV